MRDTLQRWSDLFIFFVLSGVFTVFALARRGSVLVCFAYAFFGVFLLQRDLSLSCDRGLWSLVAVGNSSCRRPREGVTMVVHIV